MGSYYLAQISLVAHTEEHQSIKALIIDAIYFKPTGCSSLLWTEQIHTNYLVVYFFFFELNELIMHGNHVLINVCAACLWIYIMCKHNLNLRPLDFRDLDVSIAEGRLDCRICSHSIFRIERFRNRLLNRCSTAIRLSWTVTMDLDPVH